MSKILKIILIGAYSSVILQLIKTLTMDNTEEIISLNYVFRTPGSLKRMHQEVIKHKKSSKPISLDFKKPLRLPTDLKFILKYTDVFGQFDKTFKSGQRTLLDYNCTFFNCYLTNDKTFLLDIRYFDAIIFDVENNWERHPMLRAPHQKYIFSAWESADNYPVCDPSFDSYYNWTWSYKLNSDILQTYFKVVDKNDKVVGPKINMTWIDPMKPTSDEVKQKLAIKKKTAAWFVSNCYAKSRRIKLTNQLQKALSKFGHKIDVYGWCGNLTCSRDRQQDCLELLKDEYYFYLSFENSLSEDYVTEKIIYPLQHYTVPVVYGGADYSRFLPPKSYINAGELDSDAVASLMMDAIHNREIYYEYFRWHNHYQYVETRGRHDVCALCQSLNETPKSSVVHNLRQWWNPNHTDLCKSGDMQKIITF